MKRATTPHGEDYERGQHDHHRVDGPLRNEARSESRTPSPESSVTSTIEKLRAPHADAITPRARGSSANTRPGDWLKF